MDYEKKYKEALSWMQSLYNGLHGATKKDAEHYFPELKESEDEKIRKWLIGYFTQYIIDGMPQVFSNGLNVKDVIAWLEKQGEKVIPKNVDEAALQYVDTCPVNGEITHDNITEPYWNNHSMINAYKAGWLKKQGEQKQDPCDNCKDVMLNCHNFPCTKKKAFEQGKSVLEVINDENVDNANKVEPKDYSSIDPHFGKPIDKVKWSPQEEDCICQLESLVKEQWRHAERVHNSVNIKKMSELMFFLKTLNPNKKSQRIISAEVKEAKYANPAWSEEDEKTLNNILSCIEYCQDEALEARYNGNRNVDTKRYEQMSDWLKSLKDRVQSQPKRKWSEWDRSKIQRICKYLDEAKKYYADITEVRECIDWLKFLRPQYTWQPSDEQMKQLGWVAEQNKNNMIGKELMTLYGDLKKLK